MKLSVKKISIVLSVCALSILAPITAHAAKWEQDNTGWWYDYENGSYAKSKWENISGIWYLFNDSGYMRTGWVRDNGKYYYLNNSGAMLSNAITPDGYIVNKKGEWISQSISLSEVTVAINNHWGDYATEYFNYVDGSVYKKFNTNCENLSNAVNSSGTDKLDKMQTAIDNLKDIDFSTYYNSYNKLLKYHSTIAETFRVSMIHYGTIYIDGMKNYDNNSISIALNGMVSSTTNANNDFKDLKNAVN